jgi:hypothetical protein
MVNNLFDGAGKGIASALKVVPDFLSRPVFYPKT